MLLAYAGLTLTVHSAFGQHHRCLFSAAAAAYSQLNSNSLRSFVTVHLHVCRGLPGPLITDL